MHVAHFFQFFNICTPANACLFHLLHMVINFIITAEVKCKKYLVRKKCLLYIWWKLEVILFLFIKHEALY